MWGYKFRLIAQYVVFLIVFVLGCDENKPSNVKAGYFPSIKPADLVGSWRATRKGFRDRTYSMGHSYWFFRIKGGHLHLKTGAAAIATTTEFQGSTAYSVDRLLCLKFRFPI